MRTIDDVRTYVRQHLDNHLTRRVAADDSTGLNVSLAAPSGDALWTQWDSALAWARQWRHEESKLPEGSTLEWVNRHLTSPRRGNPERTRVTSRQEMPNRIHISSIDAAAHFAGDPYPTKLTRTRQRWHTLTHEFPDSADLHALNTLTDWPQTDFNLMISTAAWFAANPVPNNAWTPRQVPVPGIHAKWLDRAGRRALIQRLAALPELHLLTRPAQSRLTYLDPNHAAAGRRRWDIVTTGDPVSLPYPPRVVIIIENRDTSFYFPPVITHGIAVHGDGTAAIGLITSIRPLVETAGQLFYWGDIDTGGLRIVAALRARGHDITTICMDTATYTAYAQFGTNTDEHGRPIPPGNPTPPAELTNAETDLYQLLTDPNSPGPRRIEQERISLPDAIRALQARPTGTPIT